MDGKRTQEDVNLILDPNTHILMYTYLYLYKLYILQKDHIQKRPYLVMKNMGPVSLQSHI